MRRLSVDGLRDEGREVRHLAAAVQRCTTFMARSVQHLLLTRQIQLLQQLAAILRLFLLLLLLGPENKGRQTKNLI